MPIDSNIPLQGRPAAIDAFGAFQQGQAIRQNAMANESGKIVLDQQRGAANDQLLARAARMGASSAADWDAAFGQLAEQVPEAAQYIGKWTPFAAQNLVRGVMPAAPAGGGIGGARGGGIPAAAGDESPGFGGGAPGSNKNMQAPTPAGPDLSSLTPEQAKNEYEKLNMALNLLGQVRDAATFDAAIDQFATVVPGVTQLKGRFNELSFVPMNNEPSQFMQWFKTLESLRDRLQPIATAQAMGVPVRGPQPGYNTQYTEAGPIVATTPVGGGKPSFEFAPVSGNPREEFLPKPGAAGGGAGGAGDPELVYDENGKLMIDENTRRRLAYAVAYLKRHQKPPPMGNSKASAADRKIVWALAGEGGQTTLDQDVSRWADTMASKRSLGQMRTMADATTAFEDLMVENIKQIEKRMPEGVGGAWPWLNEWVQSGRTAFGDPNVPAYTGSIITVLNEYAKILSGAYGAAGITDSARAEALSYLSADMNTEQVKNSLELIRADAHNRRLTLDRKIKAITGRLGNNEPGSYIDEVEKDTPPPKNKPSWAP